MLTRYMARYIMGPEAAVIEHGALDVEAGHIVAVHISSAALPEGAQVVDLGEVVLAPGLVNAHSHAFQRALRGRTEWLHPARSSEDFWSWREAMYAHALTYDADAFEEVTRQTFEEMLRAGITCVGEFHYVHHRPDGTPYEDSNELAHRVVRAARSVGIRLTLLRVAYHRAGFERAALPEQRRFISADLESCLADQERLYEAYAHADDVRVGVAPHSIRAVPGDWLETLADWASGHDAPLHIHACEQRAEIAQSMAEYGKEPLHVFAERGVLAAGATLVHATHLTRAELDLLTSNPQATVCACPTTERNLGDGLLPAEELLSRGVRVSLGSDSHAHIDLWEEMRLVEYHERLKKERRNVLASPEIFERWYPGQSFERHDVARMLWPMGTTHGAMDLGWTQSGELAKGKLADFITIGLDGPSLRGAQAEHMASHLVFAATAGDVRDVFVGGVRRL